MNGASFGHKRTNGDCITEIDFKPSVASAIWCCCPTRICFKPGLERLVVTIEIRRSCEPVVGDNSTGIDADRRVRAS